MTCVMLSVAVRTACPYTDRLFYFFFPTQSPVAETYRVPTTVLGILYSLAC